MGDFQLMSYNLRPRARGDLGLQTLALYQLPRKSRTKPRSQHQSQTPSIPTNTIPHPHNREVVEPDHSSVTSASNVANSDGQSPVLFAASPTNPLKELLDEIYEFREPIEIGRGWSGIVYRVQISSNNCTQLVAIKMMDVLEEFEQEIKTYGHLTSHGVEGMIPDVYGYRRWSLSRCRKEFPSLDTLDRPSAGGIFMEYLGPLTPDYDAGRDIHPAYIAEYLDIMWMLRKTHVYHNDLGLNLFVAGPNKNLVLLDFAYSTLSLTRNALEAQWINSTRRILMDCVWFRASFC